ncbi:MAG: site-2 protease family protein [Acidobacteria bacterium]|nr:site-2 protease family protein [Acidobacteriota bacterium]
MPDPFAWIPVRRRKFQHPYGRHLVFFLLTLFTTSFTPAWMALFAGLNPLPLFTWPVFLNGLWYSIPVLLILSAHEFGHYFACRHHDVDATLPYFLPAPLPLTGTFGAVIRIREAFPSKRALFDIGVAGPLGGFVVLVPLLYWGITMSHVGPAGDGGLTLGEPLLWKCLEWLHFGVLPDGQDVYVHPVGLAAWWGMLATALNLLPFGQLDGGHIMYASVGRRATLLSALTLGGVVALAFGSSSWVSMAVMMTVMAFIFGFRHPRIVDEHEPLDRRRQVVALLAAFVFVICFTPVPIEILQ